MTSAQRLLPKLEQISNLGKIISLSADRLLPAQVRQDVENEQFRLEFALRTLVEEVREREADLKIKHMSKVVELLKGNDPIQTS
jgi:hypothetical protein